MSIQILSPGMKPAQWAWDPDRLAEPFRSIARRGPYLFWPMWDRGGSVIRDISRSGRNGTLHAGSSWDRLPVGGSLYDSDGPPGGYAPRVETLGGGITIIIGHKEERDPNYGGLVRLSGASGSYAIQAGWVITYPTSFAFKTITNSPFQNTNHQIPNADFGKLDYHVYALQVGFGAKKVFIDGIKHMDEAITGVLYPYTSAGLTTGQYAVDISGFGHEAFAFAWDQELTEEEIRVVSADPFGLIRPAPYLGLNLPTQAPTFIPRVIII